MSVGSDFVIYGNLFSNMPVNCSIYDIDRAELLVALRDAGTTVTLSGSAMGQPFWIPLMENGMK